MKTFFNSTLLIFLLFFAAKDLLAQKKDSTLSINGMISVTNNGFSFIPAFTLNKPASIAIVSVSKGKWSVETQVRTSLEGRPWSMAFISRYKLVNSAKAQVTAGLYYPGVSFFESLVNKNGVSETVLQSQYSIAPELNLSFPVNKNFVYGATYMFNRGLGRNPFPLNGHFVGVWSSLSNLKISKTVRFAISPQVFYLTADQYSGYYTAANLTLSKEKFPITISSMMFKSLRSDLGGKNADWNVSLNYVFGSKFIKK